jgi:hypothetical protein
MPLSAARGLYFPELPHPTKTSIILVAFGLVCSYAKAGVAHADPLLSYMKRRETFKEIKTFLLQLLHLSPS